MYLYCQSCLITRPIEIKPLRWIRNNTGEMREPRFCLRGGYLPMALTLEVVNLVWVTYQIATLIATLIVAWALTLARETA